MVTTKKVARFIPTCAIGSNDKLLKTLPNDLWKASGCCAIGLEAHTARQASISTLRPPRPLAAGAIEDLEEEEDSC